jgi:putative glutamine transport system substrate-binding protein
MYKKGQRYGMVRRLLLPLLLCFLLIFSVACSGTNSQNSSGGSEATEAKNSGSSSSSGAVNEGFVDEIKDRGFLIVGCKMDVPDLSFYDSETDTWSGLETELAWKTAAEIFEVSVEEAKEKKLVHFTGVTVADREEKLENGEVDCLFSTYTITKERAERFCLSKLLYRLHRTDGSGFRRGFQLCRKRGYSFRS